MYLHEKARILDVCGDADPGLLAEARQVHGVSLGRDAWRRLKPRILTTTPGWSEAYALFTKGEAPMVLSYTTSPAYHMIAENDARYQAASFAEGGNGFAGSPDLPCGVAAALDFACASRNFLSVAAASKGVSP